MPLTDPTVVVHSDTQAAGAGAAREAARVITQAVAANGRARVMFASAPSQLHMLESLRGLELPWSAVEVFHIDEYVGLASDDPRGFGQWLRDNLFDRVQPAEVHLLDGTDPDPASESARYSSLLTAEVVDLACIGIGVNGHIAFNEPYQWEIDETAVVAPVTLQAASRRQQVDDGCFESLDQVPTEAISVTVTGILRAQHLTVTVTGGHKRAAVQAAVTAGLNPACPATALQTHPAVTIHTDPQASPTLATAGAPDA